MPKFDYQKLFEDVTETFAFGDTYAGKAKEIGITYNDFARMRKGDAVTVEVVLKVAAYLKGDGTIVESMTHEQAVGAIIAKYITI